MNRGKHPRPHKLELCGDVIAMAKTVNDLPPAARELVEEHVKELDKFRQRYPRLWDVMMRDPTPRGRRFERKLESRYRLARAQRWLDSGGAHS